MATSLSNIDQEQIGAAREQFLKEAEEQFKSLDPEYGYDTKYKKHHDGDGVELAELKAFAKVSILKIKQIGEPDEVEK